MLGRKSVAQVPALIPVELVKRVASAPKVVYIFVYNSLAKGHRKHTAKAVVVLLAVLLFTVDLLSEYLPMNVFGDMAKTVLHTPIGKWAGLLGMLAVYFEEHHNNNDGPPGYA